MSKKVLGVVLTIAGVALMAIPGIGTALGLGVITLGAGATVAVGALIGLGLTIAGSLLMSPGKPKGLSTGQMGEQRLSATLIATEPRKSVFGHTAMATDARYQVFTGSSQEFIEMIVCVASHKVHSIDELWLDNELAWNGSVQGRYVGYLTVTPITEGTNANGIAINGTWTANCTLTGCAYLYLKFKLTGTSSSVSSPFSSGVTSRMTIRGKGALVYDPRLDSTVDGGSGSHRADDQTTWAWDDDASRNPALQELFYELGWKIGGKLAVGKGVPPARLDLASYAVAANACDESVALNGGGTEPRYRSDGVASEGDDPGAVRDNLCVAMNAVLRDAGGKITLNVIYNDLASPVTPSGKTAFDADDLIGEMQWDQTPDLAETFNIVRGRRIDSSDAGLYQPVDFPEVSLTSVDGIDRIDTIDYPFVQSNGQAQRLAKQRLERNQYQGRLTFTGKPSFWGLSLGDPFPFTHPAFGWTEKLFRCAGQKISRMGPVEIVAVEENAVIYQWDNDEAPAVTAGTPVIYDPTNSPIVKGVISAESRWIDDPTQRTTFKYDYTGTAESGEFTRDITFKLNNTSGQITSGITWTFLILTGGINSLTSASGAQSMTGAGTGSMTVSTLDTSEVKIEVSAVYSGQTYTKVITLARDVAAPPVSGGTSGTLVSKNSGFSSFSTTTFASVSGSLNGTTPAGVTAVNVNVTLDALPGSGISTNKTVECKVLRGGVLIGSVQSAPSSYDTTESLASPASFSFSINDTGLTASTAYTWDVQMRITAGTRTHDVTGTVTVTA